MSLAPDVEIVVAYASSRLQLLESMLKQLIATDEDAVDEAESEVEAYAQQCALFKATAEQAGFTFPDTLLARAAGLDAFEVDVLWLAAAPYLDPTFTVLIAEAQGDPVRDHLEPNLCLRLFCSDRNEALKRAHQLQPGAPLYDLGLVRLEPRFDTVRNWQRFCISPAGHLQSFLTGQRRLSPEVAAVAERYTPRAGLRNLPGVELLEPIRNILAGTTPNTNGHLGHARGLAVLLMGTPGTGRTRSALAVASGLERPAIAVDGRMVASFGPEVVIRAAYEAILYNEVLILRHADPFLEEEHEVSIHLTRLVERHALRVILCAEEVDTWRSSFERVLLARHRLRAHKQRKVRKAMWDALMPGSSEREVYDNLHRLNMSPLQIRKASEALQRLGLEQSDESVKLMAIARSQLTVSRNKLAKPQESRRTLEDLILDKKTMRRVEKIIDAFSNRSRVLEEWQIGTRIARGTGILCLFNGEPGTGKTMAAGVIANELGLQLMHVNVATTVDKYIGETEKNLMRIFEQANPELDLLLFDEADSLFAKRTEVKGSTDRYSNMEINVLLQLVEDYTGIAVLTTNIKKGIDPAFARRISFKIDFPVPKVKERTRIWESLLPPWIPTEESLDYEALGESIELAGGGIKNSVLRAAYHAASQERLIRYDDLYDAARAEAAAEGRLIRDESKDDEMSRFF